MWVVQSCPTVTTCIVAHQAPLSLEFFQARILEWVAMPSSRGYSWPMDQIQVSCIAGRSFTVWATSSVQSSHSAMSDSLQSHEPQHARPPCPSPTPGVHPNPCLWSRWCHPTVILCRPLLLLPSVFPSIRGFSNESALRIRWPKDWSFSFNISPSNEHPGLISFRMDWVDLLAVQGSLKSLLQHHSSKVSILLCLAFFVVQLSHPYMTTGKTIAFTRRTFVVKIMSLLFNMLSWLVISI